MEKQSRGANGFVDGKEDIQNCYFVKMMLMLAVVLSHSVVFWGGEWFTTYTPYRIVLPMKYLSKWASTFHVYGFTLVSGYIFHYLYNVCKKYQFFSRFAIQKIKRLLIPYFFVCVIWVIPITIYFEKNNTREILVNYILGVNPSQLWFLLMLFWCYIICWMIIKYIKKDILRAVVSIVLYAIGILGKHFVLDYFSFFRGLQFIVFFICGYMINEHKTNKNRKRYILLGIILHIGLFVGQICMNIQGILQSGYDLVLHLIGSITVFELLLLIGSKIKWNDSRMIHTLIKYSMPIYLFHQQIIYFVISLLNNKIDYYYIIICNYIISISGSIIIGYILKKNRITSMLIGEAPNKVLKKTS